MTGLRGVIARWRADRERVRADGRALIREHGGHAYEIARRMAQAERSGRLISPSLPHGHWARVRREVKRSQWQAASGPALSGDVLQSA